MLKDSAFFKQPKAERFSQKLLEEARKEAQAMLSRNEETAWLKIGEQEQALQISLDSSKIVGTESFEVNGKVVYVGVPREKE